MCRSDKLYESLRETLTHINPDNFPNPEENAKARATYDRLREFAITLANNDALAEAYSATLPTSFACDSLSNIPKSAFHKADRNSKSQEGPKTVHPDGQKSPELLPYHQEAHDEATQHLRTLYFEIEKNPTVTLYNPNKYNGPSLAAKEAIDRTDEINGRLLTINCFSNLSLAVGQIMRDHFVETWKLFIYASEEGKERYMAALANMCKELHYPSEWANIPPGCYNEAH